LSMVISIGVTSFLPLKRYASVGQIKGYCSDLTKVA
jgi:hypothetical protein